jgi:hypothetical protein
MASKLTLILALGPVTETITPNLPADMETVLSTAVSVYMAANPGGSPVMKADAKVSGGEILFSVNFTDGPKSVPLLSDSMALPAHWSAPLAIATELGLTPEVSVTAELAA